MSAFQKLNRVNIRKLAAGDVITERGITAEKLANGDVRWAVNIMVDGRRIHRVIGRESERVTRTQAEEFIATARTDARTGRLSLPSRKKTEFSFSEASKLYLTRLVETGGKNLVAKTRQLRLYLTPYFASQRLGTITTFEIERYKQRRKDAGASHGTVNLELATLSHLLNCAIEWGWLKFRPCRMRLLEKSEGRLIALTDEQSNALLQAAIEDPDPDCWLFVAFGLNTPMRHREILSARFDNLDLDNNRLFVPVAKGGRREQPITIELANIMRRELASRGDNVGWIFSSPRPNASTKGYRDRMSGPFKRAAMRAGLDPAVVTPHVMRHTAVTKLAQAGVDIATIQQISGHKSVAMVLRYTHVHAPHIDQAISILGRAPVEPNAIKRAGTFTRKLHRPKMERDRFTLDVRKKF